jgi:hypothetical protein
MLVAIDTETKLIEAGRLDPDLVCVSYCDESLEPILSHQADPNLAACLHNAFENHEIVGANFSFDACVLIRRFPSLLRPILKAYDEGRVHDVQLRQRLLDLAEGELDFATLVDGTTVKKYYSLAALYDRYGFGLMSKGEDTWRLRYGELIDTPLEQWPQAAKEYALLDAKATLRVFLAQEAYSDILKDGPAQARAAFALHRQSVRGMHTDEKTCKEYHAETQVEIERAKEILLKHGLLRANGTKDTKKAKARMLEVMGEDCKKTATGGVCLDAEATRDSGDPVLKAYSLFTSADKTLTRVKQLEEGAYGIPLQTSYVVLLNNGRTASREPSPPLRGSNFQNVNKKGRLRNCFVPSNREKYVLCSVDYNSDELHTVSQVQYWAYGESKLGEALNAGRDVHCEVGAGLIGSTYEETYANRKTGKWKKSRDQSKEVNYGGWGVMSPKRLMLQMNKKASSPEDHIDLRRAEQIMSAWNNRWDAERYFDWVGSLFPNGDKWGLTTIRQFISERVRGHVDFPAACNTFFSGLAADAIKFSVWKLEQACSLAGPSDALFEARPILYVHDEVLAELRRDRQHEAAYEMARIMVEAHNVYTPDFPVKAEPALMEYWDKDADKRLSSSGQLLSFHQYGPWK